ncbi:MAG: chemotaxis protein CheB [Myxococcaceae bacterium]|nr:chemotaxis protein CheB [Myxococcaceae bacterium]
MNAPRLVVVGASWGGVDALQIVLGALPATFDAAVLVVLHRAQGVRDVLQHVLQRSCSLPVGDVEDKQPILPGRVYLAPAGYHVHVEDAHFGLSVDDPVHHARPSIDVAMSTAAEALGPKVTGVVLTGAGRDGAEGLALIKRLGGCAIVQEPSDAARADLPRAALDAVQPDRVLALEEIATWLAERGGGAEVNGGASPD